MSRKVRETEVGEEELVQVLFKVTQEEKLAWQTKAKLSGSDLSKVLREQMTKWYKGERGLSQREIERQEAKDLEEIREYDAAMKDARTWPVGIPRKVTKKEILEDGITSAAIWIDEVGNLFDDEFFLLKENGDEAPGQGHGQKRWEVTWQPAILNGWRPRADDNSKWTKERWGHVVYKMKELKRLPMDFKSERETLTTEEK